MGKYTIISSRLRLARNIDGINFPAAIQKRESIDEIVRIAVLAAKELFEYKVYYMRDLDADERGCLVERHLISPMLSASNASAAVISKDKHMSIMICEEDHIRAQCLEDGLSLEQCYKDVSAYDLALRGKCRLSYDKQFGYLTACPTNVGTGMRASVMMFLPALSLLGSINDLIAELKNAGLTLRGALGEGSSAKGYCYQISNGISIGVTEKTIINRVSSAAESIEKLEDKAAQELYAMQGIKLEDSVSRSLAILQNAKLLSSEELTQHVINIKLGAGLGIISLPTDVNLDNLLIITEPYGLKKLMNCDNSAINRDKARATFVAKMLHKKEE